MEDALIRMFLIAIGLSALLLSSCAEERKGEDRTEENPTGMSKPALGVLDAGARTRKAANRAVESQDSRLEQARDLSGGGNPTGE
jgi:hypothetical protein